MIDTSGGRAGRLWQCLFMTAALLTAEMTLAAPATTQDGDVNAGQASAAAPAVAPALPTAAKAGNSIYRCMLDGVPTWQQQPCHQGDAPVALDDSLTVVPAAQRGPADLEEDATAERLKREKQRTLAARQESQRQYRIRSAIDDGYLVEGMSESQAVSLLGKPSDVSETIADNQSCRLLSWWGDVRVQFCNDEAVSITATQRD